MSPFLFLCFDPFFNDLLHLVSVRINNMDRMYSEVFDLFDVSVFIIKKNHIFIIDS